MILGFLGGACTFHVPLLGNIVSILTPSWCVSFSVFLLYQDSIACFQLNCFSLLIHTLRGYILLLYCVLIMYISLSYLALFAIGTSLNVLCVPCDSVKRRVHLVILPFQFGCVVLTHCSHNCLVVACICWLFRGGQQLFDRNWYASFWEGLGRGLALDYSLGGTINRVFFAFCNIVLHIIVSMLCFVLLTSNPQIILLLHRRNAWPCGGSSLCGNGNEQNNNHHYKTCVTQMNNNT